MRASRNPMSLETIYLSETRFQRSTAWKRRCAIGASSKISVPRR
jgi:hypothetical protein